MSPLTSRFLVVIVVSSVLVMVNLLALGPVIHNPGPCHSRGDDCPLSSLLFTLQNIVTGTAKWSNDFDLVHVVLTRFMQHQPNLVHLGMARLELFQSFCLPTMIRQTTKQFLWIIRADPELHPILKNELLRLVRSPEVMESNLNVIVVGSNGRIDNGHFRTELANADITSDTIWSGDYGLFVDYHHKAQSKIVLETGLDADDGLALHFLEDVQRNTAQLAIRIRKKLASWWRIWCIQSIDEWHFYGDENHGTDGDGVILSASESTDFCHTPGLTRVSTADHRRYMELTGFKIGDTNLTRELKLDGTGFFISHFYVKKMIPTCHVHSRNNRGDSQDVYTSCHKFMGGDYTQAIRARSPTSAGMRKIRKPPSILNGSEISNDSNMTVVDDEEGWNRAIAIFGLSKEQIKGSRNRILANLPRILDDALAGQCTTGHSCKDQSVSILKALVKKHHSDNNGGRGHFL